MTKGKRRVVLVGAGNVGSQVGPHLARMESVGAVTLIDGDKYEEANISCQQIEPRDVGKPKAVVQARRLKRINPKLEVTALAAKLEDVPLGVLRSDVIVACVDSRGTRRAIGERAALLGLPYVDAGIDADSLLVRVGVYRPGRGQACFDCLWAGVAPGSESASCTGRRENRPSTGAPSSLGGLAASILALECRKLLARSPDSATGYEVLVDAGAYNLYRNRLLIHPDCPSPAHMIEPVTSLQPVSPRASLAEVIVRTEGDSDMSEAELSLEVPGHNFLTALLCRQCGGRQSVLVLEAALAGAERVCRWCGGEVVAAGFFRRSNLAGAELEAASGKKLGSLGLRRGDVLCVRRGNRVVGWWIVEERRKREAAQGPRGMEANCRGRRAGESHG